MTAFTSWEPNHSKATLLRSGVGATHYDSVPRSAPLGEAMPCVRLEVRYARGGDRWLLRAAWGRLGGTHRAHAIAGLLANRE